MKNANNWYVITGAPSSGKTTTLNTIEKKGYKVFYEWARILIDKEMKKGKTLKEIRKDEISFQRKVLKLKINFEKKLPQKRLLFMERGIPDTTAYMKMCGVTKDKILEKAVKNCYYKRVFLLEPIEYELDYARTESQEEAILIDKLIEESYTKLHINVLRVPKMSVSRRVSFILNNL